VHKLESLREEIAAFTRFVEELRFTGGMGLAPPPSPDGSSRLARSDSDGGSGSASGARASAEDAAGDAPRGGAFSEVLATVVARAERARDDAGQASLALVQIRVGVAHLADRLSVIRQGVGASPLPPVTDETLSEVLDECSRTLVAIRDRLFRYAEATGVDLLLVEPDGEGLYPPARPPYNSSSNDDDGAGAGASGSGSGSPSSPSARRPLSREGSSAFATSISPTRQQLARLGISDEELVNARPFNTRVAAAARVHTSRTLGITGGADAAASRASGTPMHGGGGAGELILDSPAGAGVGGGGAGAEFLGEDPFEALGRAGGGGYADGGLQELDDAAGGGRDDGAALSRDAIKRVAQRSLDSHRRTAARKKKGDDGDGGGGAAAPAAAPSGAASVKAGGLRKMAGPPRHQY
jgi:hypothetical protein